MFCPVYLPVFPIPPVYLILYLFFSHASLYTKDSINWAYINLCKFKSNLKYIHLYNSNNLIIFVILFSNVHTFL